MHRSFFYIYIVICFVNCTPDNVFSESYQTHNSYWHKDSIAKFSFEINDTLQHYNCFIHLHNTEKYKYNNLYLITSIQFPYGQVVQDTLEYKMAYKDGKLIGRGLGSLKYNKLWYKEEIKFIEKGIYTVKIRHAMRDANQTKSILKLDGVEKIGFSYEQAKN